MFLMGRLRASTPQVMATLLVFSLASGVLGGILFYFDSTRPAVMSEMMEDVQVHLNVELTSKFYSDDTMSYAELASEIESVNGVEKAEIVTRLDTSHNSWYLETEYRYSFLGIENSFLDTHSEILELSPNSIPLRGNQCYIEFTTFTQQELSINDSILAEMSVIDGWRYRTLNRSFVVAGWFKANWDWGGDMSDPEAPPIVRILISRQYLSESFDFLGHQGKGSNLVESVWVTLTDEVINQNNPAAARTVLEGIRTGIEQRTVPLAVVAEFPALGAVLDYASWASSITTIAIAFSIPAIVMGIMLVTYTDNLLDDERRRDIGNIRVRGATGWQSFNWIISRSLVTGFLGSLAAIFVGIAAAILSGGVKELMVFDLNQLTDFNILITPSAALFVFSFSFSMGLLTSLPAAVRSLLLSPTDARKSLSREQQISEETLGNSITEILAMGISGLLSALMLPYLSLGNFSGFSNILIIITTVLMFGIFSLSTVRFLSRSTSAIKVKVLEQVKHGPLMPSFKIMSGISRSYSKSEALGVMFISMVFVSAFFSAISATTGSNHMKEIISFNCGADIVVDINHEAANQTLDVIDKIQRIDGVENAAAMMEYRSSVVYQIVGPYSTTTIDRRFTIFGIEPEDWGNTAFLLPYFTKDTSPEINLHQMEENDSLVLSSFRPISGFDVQDDGSYKTIYGDSLLLQLPDTDDSINVPVDIIDIFSIDDESNSETYLPGHPDLTNFLVVNMNLLRRHLNTLRVDQIYIRVSGNRDIIQITNDIENELGEAVFQIESSLIQIDDILSTRSSQSVFGIYSLNVIFSLLYLTLGMTIVTSEKNRKLSKHYSVLRALGTERKNIGIAIVSDVFLGIAIACVIGALVAMVMSLLVVQTPMIYLGANGAFDWFQLPTSIGIPIIGLSLFLLASFLIPGLLSVVAIHRQLAINLADDLNSPE